MSTGVMKTAMEALSCKHAAQGNEKVDGGLSHRKTPLLNRIYQTRSKLMHKIVTCGITSLTQSCSTELIPQLLILGAGLDSSYNSYTTRAFGVDFAHILQQRAAIQTDQPSIKLVSGDLKNADEVLDDLQKAGLDFSAPTLILLECVLSYVEPCSAQRLLSTLSTRMKHATLVMYDPVLPFNNVYGAGLAQMMHRKFEERGAPLLSCAQSIEQYMSNLRQAGWNHVTAVSVNQATQLFLSASERRADVLSEPFDEFASLALLQDLYAVGIASSHKSDFQRLHDLLYASKLSLAEREQALQDRISLAEARLNGVEQHRQLQRLAVTATANSSSTPSTVSIRRALLTDTHTLVQVYQSAFDSAAQKYSSVRKYVKFSLKALKEFEKTYSVEQRSVLFVAQCTTGSVVGCIGVKVKQLPTQTAAGLAELSHFCVAHECQRSGVGQALLSQALTHCNEVLHTQSSTSSVCLTVLRDLEAARRLYASKGFELTGTEQLGNDCELYNLRLTLPAK